MKGYHDRFGISMARYIREHEAYLLKQQTQPHDLNVLIAYHTQKIQWLQHERLIHLLVTALVVILMLFLYGLTLFLTEKLLILLLLVMVTGLFLAYLIHYFILENAVQRWYRYADQMARQNLEQPAQPTVTQGSDSKST